MTDSTAAVIAIPTAEVRTVALAVAGAPVLAAGYSGRYFVPNRVEIRYTWCSAETRTNWYRPGNSAVKIWGLTRRKDGTSGAEISRDFYATREARPAWLAALVAAHQPAGWAEDTYTGSVSGVPAVGDQYVRRTDTDLMVTVTRVRTDDEGRTAIAFEWGDHGQCGAGQCGGACPLDVFNRAFRPVGGAR